MIRVLVTGANGFVGSALCSRLAGSDYELSLAVRQMSHDRPATGQEAIVGDIGPETDWHEALMGVDVVVHLAARVHVMDETAADPLAAFRAVNLEGTERLARMAAAQGVKRLVFLSTIKVNGEATLDQPFTEKDAPAPQDAYALSKWEAEQMLLSVAAETDLEVVIIRTPLVYGPGVKGNFLRLLKLVSAGIPLPLGSISNCRSMICLDNLVDLLCCCLENPSAANQMFLVSDGEDLSTPQLLQGLARAMGTSARLFPLPLVFLNAALRLVGKQEEFNRLAGSLCIDSDYVRKRLGWQAPVSVDIGLQRTVAWFRNGCQS